MTWVWRLVLACGCVLLIGCGTDSAADPTTMRDLVFLTRDGCVNTTTMRTRLDEALTALGRPKDY
jgi:hypothetical protein